MTYASKRRKDVVSWREDRRRRVARFDTPEEAEDFEQRRAGGTDPGDAVFCYDTAQRIRYRRMLRADAGAQRGSWSAWPSDRPPSAVRTEPVM